MSENKDETQIETFQNTVKTYYTSPFMGCAGLLALCLFVYRALKSNLPPVQIVLEFCFGCCCSPCYIVYALILISQSLHSASAPSLSE